MSIVDLRQLSVRQLEPLLAEEMQHWREELHWDYRSSVELIKRFLQAHSLAGCAAMEDGGRLPRLVASSPKQSTSSKGRPSMFNSKLIATTLGIASLTFAAPAAMAGPTVGNPSQANNQGAGTAQCGSQSGGGTGVVVGPTTQVGVNSTCSRR